MELNDPDYEKYVAAKNKMYDLDGPFVRPTNIIKKMDALVAILGASATAIQMQHIKNKLDEARSELDAFYSELLVLRQEIRLKIDSRVTHGDVDSHDMQYLVYFHSRFEEFIKIIDKVLPVDINELMQSILAD